MEDSHWQERGRCRWKPPGLFFPTKKTDSCILIAKRICGKCPEKGICLRTALEDKTLEGVWGGTTEWERDVIRVVLGPGLGAQLESMTQELTQQII